LIDSLTFSTVFSTVCTVPVTVSTVPATFFSSVSSF